MQMAVWVITIVSFVCLPKFFYAICSAQEQGISILNYAIKVCTEEIERHKGKLTVKEAPRAVSFISYSVSFRTGSVL